MKKKLFNIRINISTKEEVLDDCKLFLQSNTLHEIFFLNAHCFNIAQKNKDYFQVINQAELLLNDGIGIKIASWFSGISFPENLNGTDLIPCILQFIAKKNKKVFFLGGVEGVAERAAVEAEKKIEGLQVAGFHCGFFQAEDSLELIKEINGSGAEVLVIGMGVPKQEIWASENKSYLTNVRIIIAGGAILDFFSGVIKRAPLWMRKMNIEWVYRLFLEPRRMWRRYIFGGFLFFFYVIRFYLNKTKNQNKVTA